MSSYHVSLAFVLTLAASTLGYSQESEERAARATVSFSPAGVRRYEVETWSTLAINATNMTEVESEEFVSFFIGGDSHLQFARRFWLPAAARRQTFVPIFIPPSATQPARSAEEASDSRRTSASMMRLSEAGGEERFSDAPRETNIATQPLLLDSAQAKSGILFRRLLPDVSEEVEAAERAAYETAYKARAAVLESRVMIDFAGDFIPPYPTTLDALDHMVIRGDKILNDSVGLANLRHWLYQGGRVWIMLDSTSMETVKALLGSDARCVVVDRVELTEFQMEDFSDAQRSPDDPVVTSWSSEIPVEMVRVIPGADDIHCRVDGWPAAFWQQVGSGEVLFTTLGPLGWQQSGEATAPLTSVARRFYESREETKLNPAKVAPLLKDQIGYRIPSRRLAALILGLNALALTSFGCWWARRHQLEKLAWFVPVIALLAATAFLVIGNRNTVTVPSAVVTGQIVRVAPATQESHIAAVTAVYSQESRDLDLVADSGAFAIPDLAATQDAIKRIVWDDNGQSRWINLEQPSGVVRTIESTRSVADGVRRVVAGTFDAAGFQGVLLGIDAGACEDAVMVAPPARAAAVKLDRRGSFHVGTDDVLASEQYLADGLLSDRQRSRQALLKRLLASGSKNPFGGEPSLLVWTPPLEMGIEVEGDFERSGSALISVPLQIERPEAGVDVRIPATFIKIRSFTGRQGASSVLNQWTGAWLPNATQPTRSQLRCLLPKALLPLRLTRATLTIKINAPSRSLRVEGVVDGQYMSLYERANPNGVLRIVIDRPEALQLDADGGLHLAVVVTETEAERAAGGVMSATNFENSTWQIDYVRVDAEGTVP